METCRVHVEEEILHVLVVGLNAYEPLTRRSERSGKAEERGRLIGSTAVRVVSADVVCIRPSKKFGQIRNLSEFSKVNLIGQI
jgi:hypothetical protein